MHNRVAAPRPTRREVGRPAHGDVVGDDRADRARTRPCTFFRESLGAAMPAVMTDPAELVLRATDGDRSAWESLVDMYAGMIFSIARSHRLNEADATDVSQTTWLRLVENLSRINDPSRVGAWLATTARRESLRVIGISARQVPTAEASELEPRIRNDDELDAALLAAERDERVREALAQLPPRWATMLLLLS